MLSMSHYTHAEETDGLYVVPRAVEKKMDKFQFIRYTSIGGELFQGNAGSAFRLSSFFRSGTTAK